MGMLGATERVNWAQDVDVPFSFDSTFDRDDAGLRSRTLGLRHSHGPQATAPHRTALLSASRLQLCPTDMEFTHQGRQRMMLQASDPVFPDSSDLLALPPSVFDASPSLSSRERMVDLQRSMRTPTFLTKVWRLRKATRLRSLVSCSRSCGWTVPKFRPNLAQARP